MTTKKTLTMVGTAIVIVAGGSNDTALAGIDGGGSPAASRGSITQFASVFVNGVRYNTDQAVFIVDGRLGHETDLKVGQVVTVFGTVNTDGTTGTANLVIYENAVRGTVSAVDLARNELTVLGQTVLATNDTSFSVRPGADSLADLQHGDVIEVSGHADSNGAVVATHISGADNGAEFDVTGVLTHVDESAYRLNVGTLEIDFSGATVDGFASGMPEVGQRVEVIASHMNGAGELVATWIQDAPSTIEAGTANDVEIEGLINRYESPWSFEVDGVPVTINWGTRFEGGWWFSFRPNAKVEIEGRFDSGGRLVADLVDFETGSTRQIAGLVESVSGDVAVVDGVVIRVNAETEYEDNSDADEHRFGIDDLRTGDHVRVRGYGEGADLIATRLERDDEGQGGNDDDDSDGD